MDISRRPSIDWLTTSSTYWRMHNGGCNYINLPSVQAMNMALDMLAHPPPSPQK
jgi:hypothetical protein